MSENPASPDLSSLGMDLARSFQPSWVNEPSRPTEISRMVEKFGDGGQEQRPFDKRRPGARGPRPDRPAPANRGGNRERPAGRDKRDGGRGREDNRRPAPQRPASPVFSGWEIRFVPDPRGVDGLVRQLKAGGKAYPLFDLARLVLEKSERYKVEFRRTSGPALFQVAADGTLWFSEREALSHVLANQLDKFYAREKVTVDAPKGNFAFVAQCGLSGELLGPPNHHDYQIKLRRLHAERFSNMPFEDYKGRVRMARDEETIQKWKDEQSTREEFLPLEVPEGTEPLRLKSTAEVEQHFRQHHAASQVIPAADTLEIPGPAAANDSSPVIVEFVRQALDELIRFPLPLAHVLGQEFAAKGLQVFKAHENITYVSVARPRYLDRTANPVSAGISGILDYLESHQSIPRAEQWKALVALRPVQEGVADSQRESAMAADLSWLVHEGHVIDYAKRSLEPARKPSAKPQEPSASQKTPKAGKASHRQPDLRTPHPKEPPAEISPAPEPEPSPGVPRSDETTAPLPEEKPVAPEASPAEGNPALTTSSDLV